MKAAVLCAHLVWNHALPDGNKRVALLLLRDFVERNGHSWTPPEGDPDETVAVMEALAAGELDQNALADWIRQRLG